MKLVSVNIESNKHLSRVFPFIQQELPDVLCMQEILESDIEHFKSEGYTCIFQSMTQKAAHTAYTGTALCTRGTLQNIRSFYYRDTVPGVQLFDAADKLNTVKNGVLLADCIVEGTIYTIGTTHFTWTPHGESPSEEQISDIDVFLKMMSTEGPHVMCGDFNIPRTRNALYAELIKQYTDAIPREYTSSLDASLHRLGMLPDKKDLFESFMVDYVLTQEPYTATNVKLVFSISDHAAVVATIEKSA